MYRICVFIVLFFTSPNNCYCQQTPEDKRLLDSLIKSDGFLSMLDSLNNPRSYVKLNVGIGNRLFSLNNNSLNAMEQNRKIIFIPSVEYFNKSGLGISLTGFLFHQNSKAGFYQYSLTPSYDYTSGNKIAAGISYTRFFAKEKFGNAASPIQNDLYAYVTLKKTWLKPGISFGYSTGEYNDIDFVDTTVRIQNRLVRVKFTDTINSEIKSLSLIGSVSHIFSVYGALHSNDVFYFIPQFLLNIGSTQFKVTHKTSTTTYRVFRKKKTRIRNFEEQSQKPHLKIESLGLSLDFNYSIGKFNFEPQLYLDYYLTSSDEKRLTQIFSFNVGYLL